MAESDEPRDKAAEWMKYQYERQRRAERYMARMDTMLNWFFYLWVLLMIIVLPIVLLNSK